MSDKLYVTINGKKREMNAEEKAQFEKDAADEAERQRLIEAEQKAKEDLRQSAINKLAALGLSVEEAQVIIGGN